MRVLALAMLLAPTLRAADYSEIDRLYFHRNEGSSLNESIRLAENLLARDPNDAGLEVRLARGWIRWGERQGSKKDKVSCFRKAEKTLRGAVALDPKDPDAHFWLGVAMGRRGEADGVLRSLFLVSPIRKEMEEVLRLNPRHGGAHHVLGEIYRQLPGFAGGSKKSAARELEEAVRLDPNHTSHYPALARVYIALGLKDKAREVLNSGLAVKAPDDPAEWDEDKKDCLTLLKDLGS